MGSDFKSTRSRHLTSAWPVPLCVCREASNVEGVQQWPFRAVGDALEVIPRTLAQNCGANVVRALTTLRVGPLGASYHENKSYQGAPTKQKEGHVD